MILSKGTKEVLINDVTSAFQFVYLKVDQGTAATTATSGATTVSATSVGLTAPFTGGLNQLVTSASAGTTIAAGTTVAGISADKLTLALSSPATIATGSALSFAAIAANPAKEIAAGSADGTHLRIRGYADLFQLAFAGTAAHQRSQPEVTGVISVDSSNAAQLLVSGTNAAGAITVVVRQRSIDPLAEYIKGDPGRYSRRRIYTFQVPANVTAQQVLTLLLTQINATSSLFPEADEPIELQISASLAGTVLSITCADAHVSLDVFIDDLDAISNLTVPLLKPAVATASSAGRNLYRNLKGGRIQTEGTNDPYNVPGPLELPVKGAKYSSFVFATSTARPDLAGQAAADQSVSTINKFLVYIQENATNEATIQGLATFIAATSAAVTKLYSTQTTDNATLANFIANV